MATSMHRLQISLPHDHVRFLAEQAHRRGVSMAEIVRGIIRRELKAAPAQARDSLWEIAGLGEDQGPLLQEIPVSERPDLYVAEASSGVYSRDKKAHSRTNRRRR